MGQDQETLRDGDGIGLEHPDASFEGNGVTGRTQGDDGETGLTVFSATQRSLSTSCSSSSPLGPFTERVEICERGDASILVLSAS